MDPHTVENISLHCLGLTDSGFCVFVYHVTSFVLQENSMECGSATGLIPSLPATLLCVLLVLLHRWVQLAPALRPEPNWDWLGSSHNRKNNHAREKWPRDPTYPLSLFRNARFQPTTCKAPTAIEVLGSSAQVASQNDQCCNIWLVRIIQGALFEITQASCRVICPRQLRRFYKHNNTAYNAHTSLLKCTKCQIDMHTTMFSPFR